MTTLTHQINLYRDELRPAKILCSGTQIVIGWVLSIAVCTFGSTALYAWQENTASTLANADTHIGHLSDQISSLQLALSNRRQDSALLAENDRLKSQLADGQKLVSFLHTREIDAPAAVPVSDLMSGFARQSAEGVWLNEIHINEGDLTIRGNVDDATRIPLYLQSLGRESIFRGRGFTDLSVQPGADTDQLLTFRLSSIQTKLPEEAKP